MTVKINGYEVEIKAKGVLGDRFNKNDTEDFLLRLFQDYKLATEMMNDYGIGDRLTDVYHQNCENICSVLIENGHSYKEF